MKKDSERYARGLARLTAVNGEAAQGLFAALADVAPDLSRFVVEFAFGDIHLRDGLDVKSREIATVAALAALGYAPAQLKSHLEGALNVGVSPKALAEVLLQMAVYAGFPAAINALLVLREVLAARGLLPVEGEASLDSDAIAKR